MRRYACLPVFGLALAAVLAVSCAGGPAPIAEPQKLRKERTVTVEVPVLVKETSFFVDGLVDEYVIYKYDPTLVVLVETDCYDASRPEPIERVVAEIEGGRVKAESTFGADGKLRLRREMTRDQDGRIVAERTLDQKGAVQSASSFTYDAAGNRLEWKAFDGQGLLRAVTNYEYRGGRLVLVDMKDGSGKRTGSIALEYDAAGNAARSLYKAPDGSLQKYEVSIYTDGRLSILETRTADGSLVSKTIYTYGALGQVLRAVVTDGAGAVKDSRSFEYATRQDQKTEVYWE